LYFAEEEEEQLAQEDRALSLLVMSTDQDDTFDPVDTEDLLAQMSSGRHAPPSIGFINQSNSRNNNSNSNNSNNTSTTAWPYKIRGIVTETIRTQSRQL
jgi:hypothetical protein